MYAPLKVLLSLRGLTPKELARRVRREIDKDDIFNRAAIPGFYFMLALFPLLLCMTALLGLFVQTGTELRDQMFAYLARVARRLRLSGRGHHPDAVVLPDGRGHKGLEGRKGGAAA